MKDREFGEADLRLMLEDAVWYHRDYEPGRYVIETRLLAAECEVIVEPDGGEKALVVITAYLVERED
jgi:hypothetical protein